KAKKAPVSKTFIILKSAKINAKKPISKQGRKTTTKGTSTHLAVRVALAAFKAGKRVKHVYLVRKSKVLIFDIKFKMVANRLKSICAKRTRVIDLKGKVGDAPHQACLRRKVVKRRSTSKSASKKRTT
ncbi:unnamed protein product, partial [Phaeothamnion confervicola]